MKTLVLVLVLGVLGSRGAVSLGPRDFGEFGTAARKLINAALLVPTIICPGVMDMSALDSSYSSPVARFSVGGGAAHADDELAKYAAEGNPVGVDGQCFLKKCPLETQGCASDLNCIKGLSCLARCKGGSMCSTACFAKFGSEKLDNLLACSVERYNCVNVPGKEQMGWTTDNLAELPSPPLDNFKMSELEGTWYKILGLDSRYDCFDCQKNSFHYSPSSAKLPRYRSIQKPAADGATTTASSLVVQGLEKEGRAGTTAGMEDTAEGGRLEMEAVFRVPRPQDPGYMQNRIVEELLPGSGPSDQSLARAEASNGFGTYAAPANAAEQNTVKPPLAEAMPYTDRRVQRQAVPTMRSEGKMFGLTFWENWYILGETLVKQAPDKELADPIGLKLVYYTGHTLQGSYKGAFVYSRTPEITPAVMSSATEMVGKSGLKLSDFCLIRNTCFKQRGTVGGAGDAMAGARVGGLGQGQGQGQGSDGFAMLSEGPVDSAPWWYRFLLFPRFFQATNSVAEELSDWFQDPAILSEWLVQQQQRMIIMQPFEVSPFASDGLFSVGTTGTPPKYGGR